MNNLANRLAASDPAERRDHDRKLVASDSTLRDQSGQPHSVMVRDLSTHGFAMECDRILKIGETVTLGLPGLGRAQATVLRRDGSGYGCQLAQPLSSAAIAAAFGESNVVVAPFRAVMAPNDGFPEPSVEMWSRPARLRLVIGVSVALWAAAFLLL